MEHRFRLYPCPDSCRLAGLSALTVFLSLSLLACGGGKNEGVLANSNAFMASGAASDMGSPSTKTLAAQSEGARLNRKELARVAETRVLPPVFGGALLSGAAQNPQSKTQAKASMARTAVYRFFNSATQAHFFTTNESERDRVRSTMPNMSFEGAAFYASGVDVPGLSPVYRFYNTQTGVHFYTISEDERANTVANLPQFQFEGIAYYASTLEGSGYTPLYRFFYASKGFHFYTNSAAEKDNIIAKLPQYTYEGIGYYMLGEDWIAPAVPHTGITGAQCYQAGSDTLAPCGSTGSLALNSHQDGHRATINPMSYSAVAGRPLTDCVKDNVTGLIWEGKTDDGGLRDKDKRFTHVGDGLIGDTSGYIAAVNQSKLCGHGDWRLPTVEEHLGIVNHGLVSGPSLDATWFPNALEDFFWTGSANVDAADSPWWVSFRGYSATGGAPLRAVRLVRGAGWSGPRHLIASVDYPGDEANNAVTDRKTGLTWRRCVEGRRWNGSACLGNEQLHNRESAFAHANAQNGWRLPNVKELGSLTDLGRSNPAIDTGLFPNTPATYTWTSSPGWWGSVNVGDSDWIWFVHFDQGIVGFGYRGGEGVVRLLRTDR